MKKHLKFQLGKEIIQTELSDLVVIWHLIKCKKKKCMSENQYFRSENNLHFFK